MLSETAIVGIAFLVFIPLVYKPVRATLLNILDKHTASAIRNMDHAQEMYQKAEQMLAEITEKFNEAELVAEAIIKSANEEAAAIIADAQEEIAKISAKKTELALGRINQQEKNIIENLKVSVIERALSNVNEMIIKELDANAQMELIDNSVKMISRKLVN